MRTCLLLFALLAGDAAAAPWFSDATKEAGLDHRHVNGMSGRLYFAEMMGAGGALLDYDNDGDLDLYLVQGNDFESATLSDRLFRNELLPAGRLHFTDVTEKAGLAGANGYGMGVATGDIDNDGDIDLYLTNFGSNQLWLNDGKGAFTDASASHGAGDDRWTVAASFADYDDDGWLDLYVANYTNFSLQTHRKCFNDAAEPEYCGPNAYDPLPDRLFRNVAGKRFEDATRSAGIGDATGAGLGVIAADFDGDRRVDFFVANDQGLNRLWINRGGRFTDEALLAGVAVNMEGKAEASMGVDAADYDCDGDIDLFMTHLARETNTLYVNDGTGLFEDRTMAMGLGAPSLPYTGFGTAWRDFDRDGHADLFVANGAVMRIDAQVQAGIDLPLREPNQLFANTGDGRYRDVSAETPAVSADPAVSRGAIFGDIDNDGDTDIVVTNNNGPAQLLRNDAATGSCWIGARLWDGRYNRDAYGARAVVMGREDWQRVRTDGSYVSAQDPRVILPATNCDDASVIVEWADGSRERFDDLETAAYHRLVRGAGNTESRQP